MWDIPIPTVTLQVSFKWNPVVAILMPVVSTSLFIEKHSLKLMYIVVRNHSQSILDLSSALSEFNFLHNTDHANLSRILKNANHTTIWITLVVYIITPSCIFQDFRCALVHIVGNEFESHWQPFFLCGNIPYSRIGTLGAVAPSNAFILGIIIAEFRFWKFEQK